MVDMTLPWCTYRSTHASGFYYEGKGKTEAVAAGTYQGSGIRFRLTQKQDGFTKEFWNTQILDTFHTEEDAYEAEATLVPLESLADPYRLNMTAGGRKGKYQNHSSLYRKLQSQEKAQRAIEKKARAVAKKAKEKEKLQSLKQKLKEVKSKSVK